MLLVRIDTSQSLHVGELSHTLLAVDRFFVKDAERLAGLILQWQVSDDVVLAA